jgi:hypothetical protein
LIRLKQRTPRDRKFLYRLDETPQVPGGEGQTQGHHAAVYDVDVTCEHVKEEKFAQRVLS